MRKLSRLIPVVLLAAFGCQNKPPPPKISPNPPRFCRPAAPCWPSTSEWQALGAKVKLERPLNPLAACGVDVESSDCKSAQLKLKNPYFVADLPGATITTGWLGAWTSTPSAYAVVAETPGDIAAAVNFARAHKLRLVVKGTGHDYLGRSSASDSLLVWTHRMRKVSGQSNFVADGCGARTKTPAVTAEAGARWIEVYREVTGNLGRYVQGSEAISVGAAGGFTQGGGFGSWSKKFGTAAANLLEAEVVTMDGKILKANACRNQDLFWALRGGGGGTFGIVTKVTMRTHPLPKNFGYLQGSVTASSDKAYRELLEYFVKFYAATLANDSWGDQVRIRGDNTVQLLLSSQGLTAADVERIWRPFRNWVAAHPEKFEMKTNFIEIPGKKMWNLAYLKAHVPQIVVENHRDGEEELFSWATAQSETPVFWYAFQSRWIPAELFAPAHAAELANALFAASRHWPVKLQFGKGQAGAAPEAVARGRETSMNPSLFGAAALALLAAPGQRAKVEEEGTAKKERVNTAYAIIRELSPGAGTYSNEADYFEPDWQRALWGANYERLLTIKKKWDPESMLTCHHCVGSEGDEN